MKQLLPLSLAALSTNAVFTQPLLDQSSAPVPGASYSYQVADFITVTGTGAGQTWDLTSANVTGTDQVNFIDAAGSSAGASFPGCDVVNYSPQYESYMDVTTTGLYLMGQYNPVYSITSIYTDTYNYQVYPCAMGTTWTDTYSGTYDYSGTTYDVSGNGSFNASGYGNLLVPWGTITNVLRIDVSEDYTETGGGSSYVYTAQGVYFYKPGVGYFVAQTRDASATLNGASAGTAQNLFYIDAASIGINEQDASALGVDVVPNPVGDLATLVLAATGNTTLDLIDAQGRTVLHRDLGELSPGLSTTAVDVSMFPAGVYTALIANATGERGSQRFVVVQ